MGSVSLLDETILKRPRIPRHTYYGHKAKKKFPPANLIGLKSEEASEKVIFQKAL